jgi:hypothetical protein
MECGARGGGAAWPARGDGRRWRGGMAARGERGDEVAARVFGLVGWYADVGRRGLLASGPVTDSFSKFSKPAQTL